MEHIRRSRWMMTVSMVVFGTLGPFVRRIPVSSGELASYRAVMAAVLIGGFLLVTRQPIPFRKLRRQLPLLLISGIAMGFNWIALFQAYRYTTVSVATLSYYFAPVIVTLLCPLLFRERMGTRQWICFAVSTVGIVLITGVDLSAGSDHLRGVAYGLLAACLYATVILLNKAIRGVQGLHRTFLQFLAAAGVLLPYAALTGGFHLSALDGTGWSCLMTVGLIHTGATYCLYFTALKDLSGQKAAVLSYLDPLVAVLVSVLLLGEPLSLLQALGGLLVLGSTLWNEIGTPGTLPQAPG